MSRNYRFHNPDAPYFVSFAVVEWLRIFDQDKYKDILVDNLNYCQQNKGMEIYAWVIMPTHVHLVFRSTTEVTPGRLLGEFKTHTSKKIVKLINKDNGEQNRKLFMDTFKRHGEYRSNVKYFQFWQQNNMPIELWSNKVITQKINYIHNNPIKKGMVLNPEDYKYSSAVDYSGEKGLINDVVVVPML